MSEYIEGISGETIATAAPQSVPWGSYAAMTLQPAWLILRNRSAGIGAPCCDVPHTEIRSAATSLSRFISCSSTI